MKDIVQLESELSSYLDKDEKLLWIGQPKQGFILKSTDLFLFPFLAIWVVVIIFFALSPHFMAVFELFTKIWLCLAVTMVISFLVARFWGDSYKRKKTVYALTDKRAIVKAGIFSQEISSYDLTSLTSISYTEKGNGSGTVTFGEPPATLWTMRGSNKTLFDNYKETPAYLYIMDARAVYTMLMEARKAMS
ncbi:hypothetical protein [Dysgonomonas sp. 25]|uniref:hypothetical protein n=1 Tax=Dysgonomonas sp. 25 TaxID=2302933 RepID=UPI0013D36FD8|nr:hypothetical protein [Dysgonomonas sp. 25]NDV69572.1 hypothetical protein [Dysgonomonas sp. 25]